MKNIIVVKIGSSVSMTKRKKLDEFRITHLAKQIADLQCKGIFTVLVISGAVAYGTNFINLTRGDNRLKQAAAGIGQIYLTFTFNRIFTQVNLQLAQILLTKDSLASTRQRENLKRLLTFYMEANFIPFLNENDVLDLNSFGGNDHLAAEVSVILHAKKLLILSTMVGSAHGVGGRYTKQAAIEFLTKKHIAANIVDGKAENILLNSLL